MTILSHGLTKFSGLAVIVMMGALSILVGGCFDSASKNTQVAAGLNTSQGRATVGATVNAPGANSQQTLAGNAVAEIKVLQQAPDFKLKDSKGKEVKLSDYASKPVVLHFWASWCAPCIDEIPQWLKAAKDLESLGISWIAVSLDSSWDSASKILKDSDLPANAISLIDTAMEIPETFGSFQFPETYAINGQGKIAMKWVGTQDWKSDPIVSKLKEIARK